MSDCCRQSGANLPTDAPCEAFAWDGVGEVRPFRGEEEGIVEGVY